MKKIAVVVLNWNGAKLLEQFLPSVMAYSDEAKIYIADNASTDTSIAVIKEQFPSVTIIQNDGNYGFANVRFSFKNRKHRSKPVFGNFNIRID